MAGSDRTSVSVVDGFFLRQGSRARGVMLYVWGAVAMALVVTLAWGSPRADATPLAPTRPAAKAVPVDGAEDLVSAGMTARAQGSRVLVEGLTTESSRTWANPDGSLTTETAAGAVRVKQDDGSWVDVDLDLSPGDGQVAANEHPVGLELAGSSKGADGDAKSATSTALARVEEPYIHAKGGQVLRTAKRDQVVEFDWQGRLPTPRVAKNRARYQDVRDGADLVVESRRSGFEALLEFGDATSLEKWLSSKGSKGVWDIPVRLTGVTARESSDGGVDFLTPEGVVVSRVGAPIAWDAQIDPRSGERVATSPVKLTVVQSGKGRAVLRLVPDKDWLSNPARVFPVTIDPTYASGSAATTFDTFVQSDTTTDQSASTELKVGTFDAGVTKARSFLTFTNAFKGKQIISASMSLQETHSYSCTAKPVSVYSANPASAATRWTSQPSTAGTVYGTATVAKGHSSSCPDGRISIPMTALAKAWSARTDDKVSAALKASESDSYGWKKFASSETSTPPSVTYTYNRPPSKVSAPAIGGTVTYQAPGSSSAALFGSDSTPTLSTAATDPDGNTVKVLFEVHSSQSTSSATLKASCTTSLAGSGATLSCTPGTALADGSTYHVRALPTDSLGLSAGTWSTWTSFTLAVAKPAAPVISCPTPYGNGSWAASPPSADITCTITAAGSGANAPGTIRYTLDGGSVVSVKITPSSDPNVAKTTVKVSKRQGGHRITSHAASRSGVTSTSTGYAFGYGAASLLTPATRTTTSGTVNVAGMGQPNAGAGAVTAKAQWRFAGSSDAWTDADATLDITTGDGGILTARGGWDTRTATTTAGSVDVPDRKPVTFQVRVCFTYPGGLTKCTDEAADSTITRVPHAFGEGYPVAEAGPGEVGLYTGELNVSEEDVSVPGHDGDLSISRSHLSLGGDGSVTGWPGDPVNGVFGPGFTAALDGPEAGAAGAELVDSTWLDGTVSLVDSQGQALVFAHPSGAHRTYALSDSGGTAATYLPATVESSESDSTLVLTGTGTAARLTFTEPEGTKTVFAPLAAPSTTTETQWAPMSVTEPGSDAGRTFYGRDTTGKVTRIVSTPAGMSTTDCPTTGTASQSGTRTAISALAKGCRALDINYATATTATTSTPGNIAGQVSSIQAVMWNGTAMAATTVATYTYDTSKRLVSVTDSRSGLTTGYGWHTASTRLAAITPPGLAPYRFTYDTAGATYPRLQRVTRDPATSGGPSATLASYVYGINPATTTTGLPDLTANGVGRWYQGSSPATGYAVFGSDKPITSATPTGVAAGDWAYASLHYVDGDGYEVNTATYGAGQWQITASDYDEEGRVTRELTASAINDIPTDGSSTSDQVDALSTQTDYNADGLVTDEWGPVREAAAGWNPRQPVRPHTRTIYDEGAPNGGVNPATDAPYNLPTTVTVHAAETASTAKGSDLDTLGITKNGYNTISGTTGNGWDLGTATSVTQKDPWGFDPGPDVTTVTGLDAQGRVTQQRQPKSTGNDAGTRVIAYYTSGTHPSISVCGNKPEWAGSTCRISAAAAPSSGPALPTQTVSYDQWLRPLSLAEVSGTTTRTSAVTYDTAGRAKTVTTSSNIPGSTTRPGAFSHFDPTTGLLVYTGELISGPAAHASKRTTYQYDAWGRQTSITTDLGDVKTTTYDTAGRVATETSTPPAGAGLDPQTTTYTYDGSDADGKVERRGVITKQTVTRPGTGGALTWTAAYDAEGTLERQDMPGKVTLREERDLAGQATQRSYSGQVTPVTESTDPETGEVTWAPGAPLQDQPWVTWSMYSDALGRTTQEFNGAGSAFEGVPGVIDPADAAAPSTGRAVAADKTFNYDYVGRLNRVTDRTAVSTGMTASPDDWYGAERPCTQRAYGFDSNSNRTSLTTTASTGGDCFSTAGSVVTNYDYDSANRAIHALGGTNAETYSYDAFGRQTAIPAADSPDPSAGEHSLTYYENDLIRSLSNSRFTATFSLDSHERRQASVTTGSSGEVLARLTNHYTDNSDSPDWSSRQEGTAAAVLTRNIVDLSGALGAAISQSGSVLLSITNPHGDRSSSVLLQPEISSWTPAVGVQGWVDYQEYGDQSGESSPSESSGYGWHGSEMRHTSELFSLGFTLMGARVYNSKRGLFTSPDSIYGGNANAYTHPLDPVNSSDISGLCPVCFAVPLSGGTALFLALVGAVTFYVVMVAGTAIPYPNKASKTARKYKKTRYSVYRIFNKENRMTWKYGITRVGQSRPVSQLRKCGTTRAYGWRARYGCGWEWVGTRNGWYGARYLEATLIARYARRYGNCPPGQRPSCR